MRWRGVLFVALLAHNAAFVRNCGRAALQAFLCPVALGVAPPAPSPASVAAHKTLQFVAVLHSSALASPLDLLVSLPACCAALALTGCAESSPAALQLAQVQSQPRGAHCWSNSGAVA